MARAADTTSSIRVRGSHLYLEGSRSVDRPDLQLAYTEDDDERVASGPLTEALSEITDRESIAHLEGRLAFAERQLERLGARREESGSTLTSELSVMRVRMEDALTAFAAATQEHRDEVAAAERRMRMLAAETERSCRALVESLRGELVASIEESESAGTRLEARIAGEQRMFAEEAARRASALAGTIAAGRQLLESRVESARSEVDAYIEAALADLAAAASPAGQPGAIEAVEGRVVAVRDEVLGYLQASEDKALAAAEHLESMIRQLRRRLAGDEAQWTAEVGEAGDSVARFAEVLEGMVERISSLEAAGAAERGAAGAHLAGLEQRLDQHEEWAAAGRAESASVADRLAAAERAAEGQGAVVADVRRYLEEQRGALEYLHREVGELTDRVHAPQPAWTPPVPQAAGGDEEPAAMAMVLRKLHAMEGALAALYGVAVVDPAAAEQGAVEARLDGLARGVDALTSRLGELEARLDGFLAPPAPLAVPEAPAPAELAPAPAPVAPVTPSSPPRAARRRRGAHARA